MEVQHLYVQQRGVIGKPVIMKHDYNGYYQIWSCNCGMHIVVDIVVPVVVVLHYYLVLLCVYGLPEAIPISTCTSGIDCMVFKPDGCQVS